MKIEFRDIEYFAVIAEHGHVGRAAEALGLGQPALSKSLRRLEQSAQAKLFKRTPKGVELTAAGIALLSHVQRLRLSLGDVVHEIGDLGRGRAGHLRIGAGTGFVEYLLPAACSALLNEAPKVTMTVTAATNEALVSAVRRGEFDLIVSGIPVTPHEDLVQEHLCDDEFVVYASASHRLAKHRRLTIPQVAQERWAISGVNDLSWRWLDRAFQDGGVPPPRVTLMASSTAFRFHAVASSELLGFTQRPLIHRVARQFRLVELRVNELTWTRRVGVSYRKGAYLPPVAVRLIEILRSTARKFTKKT